MLIYSPVDLIRLAERGNKAAQEHIRAWPAAKRELLLNLASHTWPETPEQRAVRLKRVADWERRPEPRKAGD